MPRYNQYDLISSIQADDIILIWETGTQSNKTIEFQAIIDAIPGSTAGNPTNQIGLTTVNGAASTYMRSDAAPALNQAIAPVWTGSHLWSLASVTPGVIACQVANNITVSTNSSAWSASYQGVTSVTPASTANLTTSIFGGGLTNIFISSHEGSGTVTNASGVYSGVFNLTSTAGGGTITNARVFHANPPSVQSGKTTTNHYGLHVRSGSVSGTLTNFYGVYVDANTSAANNYGIYSAGGLNVFVGTVRLNAASDAFQIANTQTPSAAASTGTAGTICWDTSYIYVCTTANNWKRVALSTW